MDKESGIGDARQARLLAGGLVVAALALAAWSRLSGVGVGLFMVDQVRDAVTALEIAHGTSFPSVGPQSAQSTLSLSGPFYYYLLAIPYGIDPDPIIAFGFSAVLNVTAVYLAYRLGTEMFGHTVGVIAALLYATFPMAVVSGLTLWNPGLMPPFSLAFLLSMWRYMSGRNSWWLAPALITLSIVLNLHLSGLVFVPLLALAWLLYRPAVRLFPVALGAAGALFLFVPYILIEVREGFPRLQAATAWLSRANEASLSLIAVRAAVAPFFLPAALVGPAASHAERSAMLWVAAAQTTELCLFFSGIALCCYKAAVSVDRRYVLLLSWLILPFLSIPMSPTGVVWYYFDVLYPVQFLMIGLVAHELLAPPGRSESNRQWITQAAVAAVLFLILGAQVLYLRMYFQRSRESGKVRATDEVRLDRPVGPAMVLESMTLESKRALARAFLSLPGVDATVLETRSHGTAYYHFREDRGYLVTNVSTPGRRVPNGDAPHYLVLENGSHVQPSTPPTLRPGAYAIWAYDPLIRYDSWSVLSRLLEGCRFAGDHSAAWQRITLPARVPPDMSIYSLIPFAEWPGGYNALRGALDLPAVPARLRLVVSIREAAHRQMPALYVNGLPVAAERRWAGSTFETVLSETVFDISNVARAGPNLVCFEVVGNPRFDLDVYEIH